MKNFTPRKFRYQKIKIIKSSAMQAAAFQIKRIFFISLADLNQVFTLVVSKLYTWCAELPTVWLEHILTGTQDVINTK